MNEAFRLSRIRAPRGTIAAIILLAVVFIIFGLAVSGTSPDHATATSQHFDNVGVTLATWVLDTGGR